MPKDNSPDIDDFDLDDEEELTNKDLTRLRIQLQEERVKVRTRLDRHLAEAVEDNDNLPDEMDIASRQSDQAYLLRLADKEKKLLREIDHALAKFDRGIYGICEGTEDTIGLKRLSLRPWTRYSIDYKEQLEREKGKNRRGWR